MTLPLPARAALALLPGLLAAPAAAQTPTPPGEAQGTDRAQLSVCLRQNLSRPQACIGSLAVPCLRQHTGTARGEAELSCTRREAGLWRERMEAASGLYSRGLEAGQRSRFMALQRSWEGYVAQKCAFMAEVQPADRAAGMQSACDLREVAGRAIELEKILRRQQGHASGNRDRQPRFER